MQTYVPNISPIVMFSDAVLSAAAEDQPEVSITVHYTHMGGMQAIDVLTVKRGKGTFGKTLKALDVTGPTFDFDVYEGAGGFLNKDFWKVNIFREAQTPSLALAHTCQIMHLRYPAYSQHRKLSDAARDQARKEKETFD